MTRKKKQSRPYVMRGPARPNVRRQTVLDKPDPRVPEVSVRRLSSAQIQTASPDAVTDPRLRVVIRILERWAVTHGDGEHLPLMARSEPLYLSSSDRPTPLDDRESLIVDAVYKSSPDWVRSVVKLRFRKQMGATDIQHELSIKRRQSVYEELDRVLYYVLGRLVGAGMQVDAHGSRRILTSVSETSCT